MRVLVTRPIEDTGRTSEALKAAGHDAVLAPLFAVIQLPHGMPDAWDAMVATSANAIRQARFAEEQCARPLYAVGHATAEAARHAGFGDVRSADGDAADLAAILAGGPHRRLLYLAGRPRRDAALLALGAGFSVTIVETYEMHAIDKLPQEAAAAMAKGGIDAVMHFSPRASTVFHELALSAGLHDEAARILHVFISAAAVVADYPRQRIARRPNLAAMIAALDEPEPVRN